MGIFSKKPPCPICGGKISFFLPTKIEGEYICDDCNAKIDVPAEVKNGMTIETLKDYLVFYDENQELKEKFFISESLDFGCFDTKMIFDFENKLFCLSKKPNKTVFEGAELKSFTIKEDGAMLFEGTAEGLTCYESAVPARVMALAPQITQYLMNKRLAEAIEDLDDDNEKKKNYNNDNLHIPEPFKEFKIVIHMDHPYWKTIECDMSSPDFLSSDPSVQDYMDDYRRDVDIMGQLARALMAVAYPARPESTIGNGMATQATQATQAAPTNAIEDIKKYKSLMEDGVITKEEFDAKKKQLLGI